MATLECADCGKEKDYFPSQITNLKHPYKCRSCRAKEQWKNGTYDDPHDEMMPQYPSEGKGKPDAE